MDVRIAGAHGQVARMLTRQLVADGHDVVGLIRKHDQETDILEDGARPVVLDLEVAEVKDVGEVLKGADAVVFAAGSGGGSRDRTLSVDRDAAILLLRAAESVDVGRYVMLSSMGAGNPPSEQDDDGDMAFYLRAKGAADNALQASSLAWTIVRPGGLTNDDGHGMVNLGHDVGRGEIPREDVATVLRACLEDVRTAGTVAEVISGDTPIEVAVGAAAG